MINGMKVWAVSEGNKI